MGRSFAKAGAVPPLPELLHQPSERYYAVVERTGGHYLRRFQTGGLNIIEKGIDYVIGSGNHFENVSPSRPERPVHRASRELVFRARRILGDESGIRSFR